MTKTVDRTRNDLERFRYTAPAWWEGLMRGAASQRVAARDEAALKDEWRRTDWQRKALERVGQ